MHHWRRSFHRWKQVRSPQQACLTHTLHVGGGVRWADPNVPHEEPQVCSLRMKLSVSVWALRSSGMEQATSGVTFDLDLSFDYHQKVLQENHRSL